MNHQKLYVTFWHINMIFIPSPPFWGPIPACHFDLPRLAIIQLSHALHFPENHKVTILETMTSVLMCVHRSRAFQCDPRHNGTPGLFTILVTASKGITKINKDWSCQTQAICWNETHWAWRTSAKFVQTQNLRLATLCQNHHWQVAHQLLCNCPFVNFNCHVRVQFCQLGLTCLCSCAFHFDVLFGEIEICTKVPDLNVCIIMKDNLGRTSQNEVLGDLYSKTSQARDEDFHLD